MVNDPYAVDESATEKWLDSWTGAATERAARDAGRLSEA